MGYMKRKFDQLPDSVRRQCIDEVITRIEDIDSSNVGVIAAQDVIDIVAQHLGPSIYNQAIEDAKKLMQEKMADMEYDIDALRQ